MDKTLHYVHASLDTYMSDKRNLHDVGFALDLDPDLAIWTEVGDPVMVRKIRDMVQKDFEHYRIINPDDGDILFALHRRCDFLAAGGPLAVPRKPGPARLGGHGPRRNSWLHFRKDGNTINHTGVHFVTAHVDGRGARTDEQVKQAYLLGEQMKKFGVGRDIATGSGDLNAVLPNNDAIDNVFDRFDLTTTAQERHVWTGTHGKTRLDYVWTYDHDRRVYVKRMHVIKDHDVNSDHDPIEVVLGIKEHAK